MSVAEKQSPSATAVDPFTLEIVRHDLVSIPNQIEKNIERTAFSPLVQEYKDYAVGIVSPTGEMVSQSRGSLLIFVANALGTAVRDGLEIYLHTDPARWRVARVFRGAGPLD
ncbi:MAG: hydantoinase B/oxoprolinase family protein [Alphaproteobacteria bacterium]